MKYLFVALALLATPAMAADDPLSGPPTRGPGPTAVGTPAQAGITIPVNATRGGLETIKAKQAAQAHSSRGGLESSKVRKSE